MNVPSHCLGHFPLVQDWQSLLFFFFLTFNCLNFAACTQVYAIDLLNVVQHSLIHYKTVLCLTDKL